MRRAFGFTLISAVVSVAACSSSNSTPCNQNPWECPTGQTCWPDTATSFECLNSGPGQIGSACEDSVGTATCGDGLACLATNGVNGTCTPYCSNTDPSHACTGGALCATATLLGSSITFQICATGVLATDGGAASGSSSSDAQSPSEGGSSAGGSGAGDAASESSTPDSGAAMDSGPFDASGVLVL
jgi:hypothetical protein